MRLVAVLSALCLVAACQTPCPDPDTGPINTSFRCEDGSLLNVTFTRNPDAARIAQEGYVVVDLPARVTGSGYRYNSNGAELRGRANEARWTRPGAAETVCREVEAP
jgi:Membrane-bound lysozyme-inhibitor of c-type lysozyme